MTKEALDETFSILFIVPSDYASLLEKGVASMILERDEGGFFKRVFTVHPYATKTQNINLNETHQLIEFGPEYPFSFLNFRGGGFFNYFLKPIPIIRKISQLARKEHISFIRATDPYWCGFYAWALNKLTGVPFCISIHTDYEKFFKKTGEKRGTLFLYKIFEAFVLRRAHLVMPIREHLIPYLQKRGVDPSKIRVIPHGVQIDEDPYQEDKKILESFGISSDKKVISFVGRLAKDNYVYDIIKLAKRLSKVRDNFIVLLVGDGPEGNQLRKLVKEDNLSPFVRFTGFLPKEKIITIRRQSFLSLCLKGGFSLIEACWVGCPSIAYDIEWHYELVKNNETGFLIGEGDIDSLTEATIYLLDQPSKTKEMGAKARELVIKQHEFSRTSAIKKNCYKELLQLKRTQKIPDQEVEKKNPWYTSNHLEASQKHAKPTIQRRCKFIIGCIKRHLDSSHESLIRVLDAGCGDGVHLHTLTQIQGLDIWGIDYNPLRTKRAHQNFLFAKIVHGDLLCLPLRQSVFDIVLCSQVIEHIPQDGFLLRELSQVLKPGGILILGTPNEGCLMARLRNHIFERNIMKTTDHLQFYKELIIRQKIEAAGFTIGEVMRENWFFPHQLINYFLANRTWGFKLMGMLSRIIPSQTAGYYFKCVKS